MIIHSNDISLLKTAHPPPSVVWYEGDNILDNSYEILETAGDDRIRRAGRSDSSFLTVRNELKLPSLTRDDLARRLTCTASNNNRTQPATKTVVLSMIRELYYNIIGVVYLEY